MQNLEPTAPLGLPHDTLIKKQQYFSYVGVNPSLFPLNCVYWYNLFKIQVLSKTLSHLGNASFLLVPGMHHVIWRKKKKKVLKPSCGVSVVGIWMWPIYKSCIHLFRRKPLLNCFVKIIICLEDCCSYSQQSASSYTKVIFILWNFKESLVYIFCNTSVWMKYKIYVVPRVFENVNHFMLIK